MTSDGAHHGLEFKCVPVPSSTSGIGAYLYPRVDPSQVECIVHGCRKYNFGKYFLDVLQDTYF